MPPPKYQIIPDVPMLIKDGCPGRSQHFLTVSPQKTSHLSMTCSPAEEHRPWGASSTGAASPEDSTAVMCSGIRTGESDGWSYLTEFRHFPSGTWSNLDLWTITYLFSHSLRSPSVLHGRAACAFAKLNKEFRHQFNVTVTTVTWPF